MATLARLSPPGSLDFFESDDDNDPVDNLNFGKAGEEEEVCPCLLLEIPSLEVLSSRDTLVTESLGLPSIMSLSLFSLINLRLLPLPLLPLLLLLVMLEEEEDFLFPPLH